MTLQNNTPSKLVKARKKELLDRQKLTTDPVELEKIRKLLEEVEYLLGRYAEPTTRRKINKKGQD